MIHKHPGKIVFCLMLLTALALMAVTGSRVDFTAGTTPGNPGAGKFRLWANSGSGQLECLNSSGGSCMPTGGGTPAGSTNDIQFNNAGSFGGGRCTMDSSSNVSCAGSMTTGSGGGVTGSVALSGATSGTVTIQPQAVAGTYNFNLPTSAGTSGQPLLSAGGGASPMTYGSTSGSGSFCLTTSCVMTTPNLGTPSAATLTNATGLPLSGLTTQSADTVVMNASGSSASPTAVAMPTSGTNGCAGTSNALTYNTSTHALGCNSISGGGALVLVEQHTASTSASLNFTTCISSTYDNYLIQIISLVPATNGVNLYFRFSTDGGSTWDSGNNYNVNGFVARAGGSELFGSGDTGVAQLQVNDGPAGGIENGSTNGLSGTFTFYNAASVHPFLVFQHYGVQGGHFLSSFGSGAYVSTTAVNAFQVLMSSGNIASGTIRCYGIAKT